MKLNKKAKNRVSAALVEMLEARILFSADGIAIGDSVESDEFDVALANSADSHLGDLAVALFSDKSTLGESSAIFDELQRSFGADSKSGGALELVVVDPSVENLEQLLESISFQPGVAFEFLILDPDQNGIEQISRFITGFSNVNAIHIVSHGEDGAVELGNGKLTTESIEVHQSLLESWGGYLSDNADILIYGCDLASTAEGRFFVDRLADILGSDVAASVNTTGHESLGGDWKLEYKTGEIQSDLFLSGAGKDQWVETLDISSDLIAHWTFDGNALDSSGGGHDGTFRPSASYDLGGAPGYGSAANFGGDSIDNNRYIDIPPSTAFDFGTGDFSMAFWYKADSPSSDFGERILGSFTPSSQVVIYTSNTDDLIFRLYKDSTLAAVTAENAIISDGAWHHVAAVREGSDLRLYSDGSLSASEASAGGFNVISESGYRIGATDSVGRSFEGSLDDIRIYNRALPVGDILELIEANQPPVLSGFSGPVETTSANSEAQITVGDLSNAGFVSDADGIIYGFRITSLLSGSLNIGTSSVTATPFVAGFNDTINAVNHAFWTPDANVTGTQNTFNLVAIDDALAESSPPVAAIVAIVNAQPTLTSFLSPVVSGAENSEIELKHADLATSGDESDSDGAVTSFIVESVSSGALTIGADSASSLPYQAGINDSIDAVNNAYWTPDPDVNGVVNAISVTAMDDVGAKSEAPVAVSVNLNPTSDRPVGSDKVVSVTDDTSHTFLLTDFPFSDADNDALIAVKINSLPLNGVLQLDGIDVALNEEILANDVSAGKLVYIPAPVLVPVPAGAAYDNFSFTVKDSGTPGLNLDATSNIVTINVRDGIVSVSSGVEMNANGGNDVYLVSSSPLGVLADELTFETQFAANSMAGDLVFLSYAQSATEIDELVLYLPKNETSLGVWLDGNLIKSTAIDYRAALLDGKLHALAFTWDADSGSWASYIDGVLIDQGTAASGQTVDTTTGSLVLGQKQGVLAGGFDSTQIFSGTMYDLRIWNRALSESDIKLHHNQKIDPASLPANLVANWQMDGFNGSGVIVDIVSGNNLTAGVATGSGFLPGVVRDDLHVDENSPNGTPVGYVLPVDLANSYNLVTDPYFNDHGFARNSVTAVTSGNSFGAWNVVSGAVEVYADWHFSPSPLSNDILDLSASQSGAISQTINTIPGVEYELKFALSGNGEGGDTIKSVSVTAANEAQIIDYEVDGLYWSASNLIWSHEGLRFVASSNATELRFESLENNSYGPLLADVEVRQVTPGIDTVLGANPGVSYDAASGKFYQPVLQPVDLPTASATAAASLLNGAAGRLIQIESQHENNYVIDLIAGGATRFWTGGSDSSIEEGNWRWGDEDQFWQGGASGGPVGGSFTDWETFEPNGLAVEHYLEVRKTGWNDRATTALNPFIIEWDAEAVIGRYFFTLVNDADGRFSIDTDTGQITVSDAEQLDNYVDEFHDVVIKVSDETGNSDTKTLRIEVNNINEPPEGFDKTIVLREDNVYTFSLLDFSFIDPELDELSEVIFDTVPAAGTLKVGASTVLAGDHITASQVAMLTYTPALDDTGIHSFDFRLVDDGGTDKAGVDTAETANTITIDIAPVNDAPAGASIVANLIENEVRTFNRGDFGFTDPVEGHSFQSVIITTISGAGSFTLNNISVTSGDEVSVADIDNGLLKFTPASNASGNSYAWIGFQLRDSGGDANGGVDTDQSVNVITVNITRVNNAPYGTDGAVSLLEDETKIVVAADFGFDDGTDGHELDGVYIDSLPNNGLIALNGVALTAGQRIDRADLEANLLTYTPIGNMFGIGLDLIQFRVQDDGGTANRGVDTDATGNSLVFNVVPVNDEPAFDNRTLNNNEDQVHKFSLSDFNLIDIEGHNLVDITIESLPVLGILSFNGTLVNIGDVIPASELADLEFTPPSDVFGVSYGSFYIRVRDDGGIANGGTDQDQTPNFIAFNAVSVNDAPTAIGFTRNVFEDEVLTYQSGDFGFSDLEGNAFESLLIASLPMNGTLALSNMPVTIGQSIEEMDISRMTYTPASNAVGIAYDSFKYRVQDDGGIANGGVDVSVEDSTAIIDVLSINDPPSGIGFNITVYEDTAYSFADSQFVLSDIEGHGLESILISSQPSAGSLSLFGTPVAVGQSVPVSTISSLVYTPDPDVNGPASDLYTFQVVDDGGSVNGGSDTDITANKVVIDVVSVNDAPVGIDNVVVIDEDTSYAFSATDFGFSDADNNQFQAVVIDVIPANGQLHFANMPVAAGDLIPEASISNLIYTPPLNANGTGYDAFTFRVRDDGGILNGGSDTDITANTITIDVTSLNNAPTGQNNTVVTEEDKPYNFSLVDFPFNDAEDNSLLSVTITVLPEDGLLSLSGVPAVVGEAVTQAQISSLSYTPPLNASGLQLGAFSIQLRDSGGTANGGIDTDPVWRAIFVDVSDVNDAPSGQDNNVAVYEDRAYRFTSSDFGFTDVENNEFISLVIDTLPSNGQLMLSGSPVVPGQVISTSQVGALEFLSEPDVYGAGYDTFLFSVQDDGGTANGGVNTDPISNSVTINVVSINDAPVGTDGTVSGREDSLFVFSDTDFGFVDSDGHKFESVFIETLPAIGQLVFNGIPVVAGQEIPYASIADFGFLPEADQFGTTYAMFHFTVRDNGGVSDGGVDRSTVANKMTITVASVNDAPAGKDNTVNVIEDTPRAFTAIDFGFDDPIDNNKLLSVVITGLPVNGSLELSGGAVSVGQVIGVSQILSLVFVPEPNENRPGYDSFSFVVQDNGGTSNGGIDTDSIDNTITIDVLSVNDAPDGLNRTVTTTEDIPLAFAATDFGFVDPDGNRLRALEIGSLPANGQLLHAGVAVTPGQLITASSIEKLVYVPPTSANGTAFDVFGFRVSDDGGVAIGGVDTDPIENIISINIRSSNDAPSGANTTVVTDEDTSYHFQIADFGFSDLDDDYLQAVIISTLPVQGRLMLAGMPVVAGQTINQLIISDLEFVPKPNANALSYDSFTFQVQDGGGVLNGGVDTDLTAKEITIDVTGLNDSPLGKDKTISMLEDTPYTFGLSDFAYSDIENHELLNIIITTLPINGQLSLDGVPVVPGQSISTSLIGTLVFTPEPDVTRVGYDSFAFLVQDNGLVANGGADIDTAENYININVGSVNDAPAGTDATVITNEDEPYNFSATDFGFIDSDNNRLLSIIIDTLPSSGQLNLFGNPVVVGQNVPLVSVVHLWFAPEYNANGSAYDSFTFRVQDDGGTVNGGVDIGPIVNTIAIDIVSMNDAPSGKDKLVTTAEDVVYSFSALDFGFADIDNNDLLAVTIMKLPENGQLLLSSVAVMEGQMIAGGQLSSLQFVPEPGVSRSGYDSITFTVSDNGGMLNGGLNTDPTPNVITFDVFSVNDAPEGADNTIVTREDNDHIFSSADFGFSDSDGNSLQSLVIATLPIKGMLTLSGVALSAGQIISADLIGDLAFTPEPGVNQTGYDSFTFLLQDDGGTLNGGNDTDYLARNIIIDVSSMNDAPAGTDKIVSTLEDSAYIFGVSDFGFTDADNNNLLSVVVDSLPANGLLSLSGMPVVIGQNVEATRLDDLEYLPGLDANGTAFDSFEFRVMDDGGAGSGGLNTALQSNTWSVNVVSVNDAPVSFDQQLVTLEDESYAFSTGDFIFSDSESHGLRSVTITSLPQKGLLSVGGVPVVVTQIIDASDLPDFIYTPQANANGIASFTFQIQDDGGTVNGGQNTSQAVSSIIFDVQPVNDEPVGLDTVVTTAEDSAYTFVLSDFGIVDIESDVVKSVVISALPENGGLYLAGAPVALNQAIDFSEINSLVYMPQAHANGVAYDQIHVVVIDNGGVVNGGVDTASVASRVQIDVTPVNDPPAGHDVVITILEDAIYKLMPEDFGFNDTVDANGFRSVRIDALSTAGELTVAGVPVTMGMLIDYASILSGDLVFEPRSNANGLAYDEFEFSVVDDGGTSSGGLDTDPGSNSFRFNVIAVNDSPESSDTTIQVVEDTDYLFSLAEFTFSDSPDLNTLEAIVIESLPGSGNLQISGSDVSVGQSVTLIELLNGDLIYRPPADTVGAGLTSFAFRVQDDGTESNNGSNRSINTNTVFIDVLNVNDAPHGQSQLIALAEAGVHMFKKSDFGFTDPLDGNQLAGVSIRQVPGAGLLNLSSTPVVVGQFITVADIDAELLSFVAPTDTVSGSVNAEIGFRVVDDGGTSHFGMDTDIQDRFIEFDIVGFNDTPRLALTDVTVDEGSESLLDASLITALDVDDGPDELLLTLERSPANGVLLLNGSPIDEKATFSVAQLINDELYYAHNGSETSDDTFLLALRDGGEDGVRAVFGQFNIAVNEVIDPLPELVDDNLVIAFGLSVAAGETSELSSGGASVIDNDMLLSGDEHFITLETPPLHGTVTFNEDGTFRYVHDGGQILQDSFTYRVTNSDNVFQIAKVSVSVEPPLASAFEVPVNSEELVVDSEAELAIEVEAPEVEQGDEPVGEVTDPEFALPTSYIEVDRSSRVDSVVFFENELNNTVVAELRHYVKDIGVTQHNQNTNLAFAKAVDSSRSGFSDDLELTDADLRGIADNRYFQDALSRIDKELTDADTNSSRRYLLGTEMAYGVSLSATAGVLAWGLRGGALFASMMAATPLWISIDPIRIITDKKSEEEGESDLVERVFD